MSNQVCPYCYQAYLDLGWHNNKNCQPVIDNMTKRCRELGHERRDVDMGGGFRGLEHVVSCKDCKYVYRYDSSD